MLKVEGIVVWRDNKNKDYPVIAVGEGRYPIQVTVKPETYERIKVNEKIEINVGAKAKITNDGSRAFINYWELK